MVAITLWFHLCFNFLSRHQCPKKFLPLYFIQNVLIIPYGSGQYFWKFSVKKKNFCNKIFCMYNAAMLNFWLSAHHDFILAIIFCQYTNFIPFSLNIPIPYSSGLNFPIFPVKKDFCNKIFCMYNAAMMHQQSIFCVTDEVEVSFLWCINSQFSIGTMKQCLNLLEFSTWS